MTPPDTDPVAPVRWGVLGAAAIARNKVIPGMQRSALCDVVALASRDAQRARETARELGIGRVHDSYDALLDDPEIEAVYVPLPNHLHVPWTIRAAERGKHVLCEKPLALSAPEAHELIAVRERTGVHIGEAFMVRTHPQWIAVQELIASGRIGELRHIGGHLGYYRRDPNDIRSHVEWGGGALLDVGCYAVMLSRWLFGDEPDEVMAMIDRDPELGIDRLASAMLRFPAGHASFTCGSQIVRHQRMQVFGTERRIDVETPLNAPPDRACRIFIDDGSQLAGGSAEVMTFPVVDQYTTQAEAFSRAVRGLGTFPITLADSVANMAVIDALFRSATSERWEAPLTARSSS
jgi:predicted dehydrogenase